MNYDLIGYRSGDLVKMDVLIAGEKIDVLAQIIDRGELIHKAQFIVKRLKDLIPRQMFEVSVQAAVGGKILARENIPAMKKDVTGYLYGGDITRKRKLWEKQKEGKKKMKKLGRVEIPTDVFIKLLKY
jgi:GTP-binding protein LepA